LIDHETIAKLAAGASGSGLAAWLARATGFTLVVMFVGGLSAAYFIGPAVAGWFNLVEHQPAVGFVVGFVAILFLRKVHDVLESIPAGSVGSALVEWVRKVLGLPPKAEGGGK
jgi:hypothetical protein